MGREIRMVPPNFEHPKDHEGQYIPMYNISYKEEAENWIKNFLDFQKSTNKPRGLDYYWEYGGPPPDNLCEDVLYRSFDKQEATWFQVYETVTEGTPVTPPFETERELIDYIVSSCMASREAAEKFVFFDKYCPSMAMNNGVIYEGIETVLLV